MKLTAKFLREIMKVRRQWDDIFEMLKEKNVNQGFCMQQFILWLKVKFNLHSKTKYRIHDEKICLTRKKKRKSFSLKGNDTRW